VLCNPLSAEGTAKPEGEAHAGIESLWTLDFLALKRLMLEI